MYYFTLQHARQNILVTDVPVGTTIPSCLDELETSRVDLKSYGCIIFRLPVAQQFSPNQISKLVEETYPADRTVLYREDDPFGEIARTSVRLLYSYGYEWHLSIKSLNELAPDEPINEKEWLEAIKKAEMQSLVERGCADFPEIDGYAYETPSGKLVKSFMRVGNIQISRGALDGLFFWLIPHLKECNGLLVDTWSISSTSLNAARRIATYDPSRKPLAMEILSGYFAETEDRLSDIKHRVDRLKAEVESRGEQLHLTTIMSAFSSGSLFELLRHNLDGLTKSSNYVTLFKLQETENGPEFLVDYSGNPKYDEATGSVTPIRIDPRAFSIQRQIDAPLEIDNPKVKATGFIPFDLSVTRGKRRGLVTVHRNYDKPDDKRHHAIWLDMERLMDDPQFQQAFRDKLVEKVAQPSMIVSPDHPAGRKMAEIARQTFSLPDGVIFQHQNLEPNYPPFDVPQRIAKLGTDDLLLVLDDTFITGSRLTNFQKGLRNVNFGGAAHYVAAIARPDVSTAWHETTRRNWGFAGDKADYVDQVILPNWGVEDCPWCDESKRIGQALGQIENPQTRKFWEKRKELLDSAHPLPSSSIFMTRDPSREQRPGSLGFGRTSVFGDVSEDDPWIFASVASLIQQMRHNEKRDRQKYKLDRPHGPLWTMLKYQHYLNEKFTDSLLRASILRSAHPYELIYSDPAVEARRNRRAKHLAEMPTDHDGDLGYEIYAAAICGKFPGLWKDRASLDFMFTNEGEIEK